MRDFISATTLSSSSADCALSSRLDEPNRSAMAFGTTLRHDRAHRGRAEDLLGLPLELRLGQAHREHGGEAGEDVVLLELVVADLEAAGVLLDLLTQELQQPLVEARSGGCRPSASR